MPKGLHAFHFRAQNYGLYSFSAIKSFLVLRFLLYGERLCPCFCRLYAGGLWILGKKCVWIGANLLYLRP